ncbi:MAG: NUDIX domain-containing protein [Prevotellaceae bacterium]|jgi:ADP-ribose pyrophosphatase YjhB (NUDIX family)|nr:NUDIX domain-containing protein [Prevotellaceae bacterium]
MNSNDTVISVFSENKNLQIPASEWERFCSGYKVVEAAGGLVYNPKGERLMIYRRGYWDLPKGKVEKNEKPEECALREVKEECGVHGLSIQKLICTTRHTYREKGQAILKISHWYAMSCDNGNPPIPQTEEDITIAEWSDYKKVTENLRGCYPSISEVFSVAKQLPFTIDN